MSNPDTRAERRARLEAAGAIAPTPRRSLELPPIDTSGYQPAVPKRIRDVVYFAGLGVAAAVMLGVGIGNVWFPEVADQVNQTGVIVGQTAALITAGLGVVYRPGAGRG